MIRISTRRDVAPQIDGYAEESFFDDLCNAVWEALGDDLGEAAQVAPSGTVSHYEVERDDLDNFCAEFARQQ